MSQIAQWVPENQPAANIRLSFMNRPKRTSIAIRNTFNRPPWVLRRDARQGSLVCRGIRKRRVAYPIGLRFSDPRRHLECGEVKLLPRRYRRGF